MKRARARRGMTLLEVMVSVAMLAGMVLAISYATLPLNRAISSSSIGLDLDQQGRRLMNELRREVRQSGFEELTVGPNAPAMLDMIKVPGDGVTVAGVSTATTYSVGDRVVLLQFKMRQRHTRIDNNNDGDGDDSGESPAWRPTDSTVDTADNWIVIAATAVDTFRGVPGTVLRWNLTRTEPGKGTVGLASNVSNFGVGRPFNDDAVQIRLELMQPDPKWAGATPPPPYVRVFEEQIEFLNKKP